MHHNEERSIASLKLDRDDTLAAFTQGTIAEQTRILTKRTITRPSVVLNWRATHSYKTGFHIDQEEMTLILLKRYWKNNKTATFTISYNAVKNFIIIVLDVLITEYPMKNTPICYYNFLGI